MLKVFITFILLMFLGATNVFALTSKEMGVIINLAGKQRMLTQKMSKESLLIKNNIDKNTNIQLLKKDAELFDKTLNGLINGDEELGLVKLDDEIVQKQLQKVKSLWKPFKNAILKVIHKKATNKDYQYIVKNNEKLLKQMHKAVLLLVKESKKISKIKSKLAEDINIAGRQRMLTQKMAKDMLQILSHIDVAKSKMDLKQTKKLFDKSLKFLQKRVQLSNIKKQLKIVENIWKKEKKFLNPKFAKKDRIKLIVALLDKTLQEMDKAVKMYQNSAKREIIAKSLSNIVNQLIMQKNLKGLVINLSGRQRMLTQRITKDALLIATGIDKEFAKKDLIFSANLYNKTLNGFINGDISQKLVATKDPKIRQFLQKVKKEWEPFYKNSIKFANTKDTKALQYIVANNEKMLKISHQLVQLYKNSTTSSKISKEMAEKIDLSGRQRMLSQKILKEKLLVLYNIQKSKNQPKLQKDVEDFDNVLHDLMYGSKKRNWGPESINHILKQLKIVESIWKKFKPLMYKDKLSKSELKSINKLNMKLLKEMDKAVKMYQEASDIYKDKLALKGFYNRWLK